MDFKEIATIKKLIKENKKHEYNDPCLIEHQKGYHNALVELMNKLGIEHDEIFYY